MSEWENVLGFAVLHYFVIFLHVLSGSGRLIVDHGMSLEAQINGLCWRSHRRG